MADSSVAVTAGAGTTIDTYQLPGGDHRQYVIPIDRGGYSGRATTFRIPGRAGTTGQKLFALHNATGSTIAVDVHQVTIDLVQTVIKAVTVLPPVIRLSKFTALPANGTTMAKTSEDSALSSSASVTLWQDASADGTSSATALAVTAVSGITQEYAPRLITAAGYEPADRVEFLNSGEITLRPLEGVVLELVYVLATQNPTSDMWIGSLRWAEYTP